MYGDSWTGEHSAQTIPVVLQIGELSVVHSSSVADKIGESTSWTQLEQVCQALMALETVAYTCSPFVLLSKKSFAT